MANPSPTDIPVAMLSQALLDLRAARGNVSTTRETVLGYFKTGSAGGFQIGSLMRWLFFWPNKKQSVIAQVGYSAKELRQLIEILKEKHSRSELGIPPDQFPPSNSP